MSMHRGRHRNLRASAASTLVVRAPRTRCLSPILIAVAGLGLSACYSPESPAPLPLQSAAPFSDTGESPPPIEWWTAFGDESLDSSIHLALSDNFSLAAAWERLKAAEAIVRRQRADLSPDLDGFADAERIESSGGDDQTRLALGLAASYEVDLWGRIESAVEAERFRASATAADYRAAAITLSAEVASTWYELAEARLQLELIESQLETNLKVLQVLEERFAVGQSNSADVLRQRQLVEATREQILLAQARIGVLRHELAVLEGRPPQEPRPLDHAALPALPDIPATGLPAELLRRRPDVLSAYLQLLAADELIAAVVADQYPRIDLSASLETAAENPSDLFTDWLLSLAGQAIAPLFDAGERQAEIERTEAVRRELLAQYGQTVLDAFREVEDALVQEASEVRRIRSLEDQLALARLTYQQLRSQYLNGAADFIDVLTALREQQQIERDFLAARLNRVAFRISLHRALAGGFETPREKEQEMTRNESDSHPAENEGDPARG